MELISTTVDVLSNVILWMLSKMVHGTLRLLVLILCGIERGYIIFWLCYYILRDKWTSNTEAPDTVEVEVVYESSNLDEQLQRRHQTCTKYLEHKDFIPVEDLEMKHLPNQWQEPWAYRKIKNLSQQAVKLCVSYVSPARPDAYDCAEWRGKTPIRWGSGYTLINRSYLEKPTQLCPLPNCNVPGRHYVTADFTVFTVAHVVYDSRECEQTTVKFYLSSWDGEEPKVVEAQGVRTSGSSGVKGERCELTCVSHDLDLFQKVLDSLDDSPVPRDAQLSTRREPIVAVISYPHGLTKQITFGECTSIREELSLKSCLKNGAKQTCRSVLPHFKETLPFFAGNGGPVYEKCLAFIHKMEQNPDSTLGDLDNTPINDTDLKEYKEVLKLIIGLTDIRAPAPDLPAVSRATWLFSPGMDLSNTQPCMDAFRGAFPNTPLTLLQLSGGDVSLFWSSMTYTASTCPGSSGAPVFLLFDHDDTTMGVHQITSHFGAKRVTDHFGAKRKENCSGWPINISPNPFRPLPASIQRLLNKTERVC